eukprot:c8637_g1_i4.p1 GENE.c8637_g1_i4~~c8637_g1_i4.p1  ORF type:complete len:443 (-),score=72.95 c8637_g1_i4:22-1350(-)
MRRSESFEGNQSGSFLVSVLCNFTAQYNISAITICLIVMKDLYPRTEKSELIALIGVFLGSILGQSLFGYIGDVMGRRKALQYANVCCALGALGTALLTGGKELVLYSSIFAWRVVLGVGAGALIPLSAIFAAEHKEFANIIERRRHVAWAMFWQLPGTFFPFFVAFVLSKAFPNAIDLQWRMTLGLGAVPALVTLLIGMGSEEAKCYRIASQEVSISNSLRKVDHWHKLFGTGGAWWCSAVTQYGPFLVTPIILANLFDTQEDAETVSSQTWKSCFINVVGMIGVMTCISLFSSLGTKHQQLWGFLFIAFAYFMLGACYGMVDDFLLFFLFCLAMFAIHAGPRVTTFVLATEVFPPEVRSTFVGLSAAAGSCGALVITCANYALYDTYGLATSLVLFGLVALLGVVITHLCCNHIEGEQLKPPRVSEERSIVRTAKYTEYV